MNESGKHRPVDDETVDVAAAAVWQAIGYNNFDGEETTFQQALHGDAPRLRGYAYSCQRIARAALEAVRKARFFDGDGLDPEDEIAALTKAGSPT